MTVKTAVSFTDRHHAYAKRKVAEGTHASVSAVIAEAMESRIAAEEERMRMVDAMAEELKRRAAIPREEWVDMDVDDMFDSIRARIRSRAT